MTADTPDRGDLRQKMLDDATAHRDQIAAARDTARADRDELRAQLAKIAAEMNERIVVLTTEIGTLAADLADADGLVRSLTPRKPRTVKTAEEATTALLSGQSVTLPDGTYADVDTEQ